MQEHRLRRGKGKRGQEIEIVSCYSTQRGGCFLKGGYSVIVVLCTGFVQALLLALYH